MASNGAFLQTSEASATLSPKILTGGWHEWETEFSVLPMNWDTLTCLLGIDGQKPGGLSLCHSHQLPDQLSPTLPVTTNHEVDGACFPALLGSLIRLSGGHNFLSICPMDCELLRAAPVYPESPKPRAVPTISLQTI